MAAPHITGLVGLIRSINPLLSTKLSTDPRSGGEIGDALSAGATAVVSDPADPLGCIRGCGAGIPNALNALNKATGTIANVQLNNRLTPMFQLRSDAAAKLDKSAASLAVAEAWLSTTSAQVAMAALNGTLYYTGDMDAPVSGNVFDFGVNSMLAYKAGFENGTSTTHAIPASQYRHRMWGTSDQSTTLPFASFYVFSTENAPANTTLLPLYRMSSKCYGLRKHFYTTNDTTRNQYAAGPGQASFGTSLTGCITGPNASDRGYFYDGVEGYIFSTQQPGTIALNSGYKTATGTANSGWALFTADEASRFTDYNTGVSILGYVYPAVAWNGGVATYNDFDSDGLSDSYERAIGLNEQAADSDCDAVNDGVEFPMAGLSNSDPMHNSNCADLRPSKPALYQYRLTNPIGPSAGTGVKVEFSYLIVTVSTPLLSPAVPTPPLGWSCPLTSTVFQGGNAFLYVYTCENGLAFNKGQIADFTVPKTGTTAAPFQVQVVTTSIDPVSGNNLVN